MADISMPDVLLRPLIEAALREDLGRAGDVTSDALVPGELVWTAYFNARSDGILSGLAVVRLVFETIDTRVVFRAFKSDGDVLRAGDCVASVQGRARSLLAAERVALNFLCHMSGIASETHKLVEAVTPYKACICCTRKTTPGLRTIEKYSVRMGGGRNHRFGLDDAFLIKDNHIAVAGGIRPALERARLAAGHLVKIEIEVDGLDQLQEVLDLLPLYPVDAVLLDNMGPAILEQAVKKVAGRVTTEASGGVTLVTVASIAATGVDLISVGWITHSAPILDIGLDDVAGHQN